jgi:hypothetical protein
MALYKELLENELNNNLEKAIEESLKITQKEILNNEELELIKSIEELSLKTFFEDSKLFSSNNVSSSSNNVSSSSNNVSSSSNSASSSSNNATTSSSCNKASASSSNTTLLKSKSIKTYNYDQKIKINKQSYENMITEISKLKKEKHELWKKKNNI